MAGNPRRQKTGKPASKNKGLGTKIIFDGKEATTNAKNFIFRRTFKFIY